MDVMFFPSEENVGKLANHIHRARVSLQICVFTITNNKLANAVLDQHRKGIKVRIITDDECVKNKGSDVERMAQAGIEVRTDDSKQNHMHNKFLIVDGNHVVTGSFNWTVAAGFNNQENLLVSDDKFYVKAY